MNNETKDIQKKEAEAPAGAERTRPRKVYTPTVDIIERKDDIALIADMPGVDENNIEVTLEKNILTIYGKVEPEGSEDKKLVMAEYGIGDYQRTFTLTEEVDRNRIKAVMKNGVLRLILPKSEAIKSRKIEVRGEA